MRRLSTPIVLLALIAVSCGGGSDPAPTSTSAVATTAASTTTLLETTTTVATTSTTEATTTTEPTTLAPAASPPLVITSVDFDEEWVEITNVSGSDYSLEGHFICNFPTYASIADIGTVAAGESFTVELSVLNAGSASGEVGIYTGSDFGNSDAMVTYVEWGTPNHGRSGVAVAAGLWTAGDYVDNGRASFRALTTGGSGDDYVLVE